MTACKMLAKSTKTLKKKCILELQTDPGTLLKSNNTLLNKLYSHTPAKTVYNILIFVIIVCEMGHPRKLKKLNTIDRKTISNAPFLSLHHTEDFIMTPRYSRIICSLFSLQGLVFVLANSQ